ncbi:hypothetical protein FVEG_16921 [Fusarium verticillioides 7600]|uniref:Uncharacterized protein n=1 Tax=Gibberella moniliformis (strain M3125 / FGSC 7600) TaxID=334819 RepID=W7MWB8_GIBM7|nr:hypothetical protein FVEG_16921 [Fusarium verticillioides 7600]EWG52094.1 hypothetical protein FVEG_16921 [Fusarium verticillioides 7600]
MWCIRPNHSKWNTIADQFYKPTKMPVVNDPTSPSEPEVSQQSPSSNKETYSLSLSEHTRNQIAVLLKSPNAQLSPDLAFLPSSCVLSLPRMNSGSSASTQT